MCSVHVLTVCAVSTISIVPLRFLFAVCCGPLLEHNLITANASRALAPMPGLRLLREWLPRAAGSGLDCGWQGMLMDQ
jgi:hypothetical protein